MSKIDFSKEDILFIGNEQINIDNDQFKTNDSIDLQKIRKKIEPWLTTVFQSEHLSLLVGTGLTIALAESGGFPNRINFEGKFNDKIKNKADEEAQKFERGEANFEDDLRVAIELLKGLVIQNENEEANLLKKCINKELCNLIKSIIDAEKQFLSSIKNSNQNNQTVKTNKKNESKKSLNKLTLLTKFLLSFASRTASRDRLNIFTTNYDRIIEYGLDRAGLLTLDRFIGKINPIMRFHRIDLDYHYNPPGIRGEPRYVEGVVRYTKLHGSIDWKFEDKQIVKLPIAFGQDIRDYFESPLTNVVIYPNSSKAIETSYFPYSELFRDFSTAICRPNSVLVTYGYGFGDSHINQIIIDMLTIPSTHLVIISYDNASGRIEKFIKQCNESQLTLIIGSNLAELETLVNYYLPKPTIDYITDRQVRIMEKRKILQETEDI
ncbi:MAG TPA: fibronectin-binding protein (FBP) [Bacteroidia bacterium]|nr:fibronectin-binding protein (FBP) [Bacteroidia bacterium]